MESHEEMPRQSITISNRWGLTALVLMLVLCATAGASLFYFVREHRQARDLAATNQALNASLGQMQNQLQALTDKFNALNTASQAPAPRRSMTVSSKPPAMSKRAHARATTHQLASRRKPTDDPRFNQMQQQLSEQQKQLAATR